MGDTAIAKVTDSGLYYRQADELNTRTSVQNDVKLIECSTLNLAKHYEMLILRIQPEIVALIFARFCCPQKK